MVGEHTRICPSAFPPGIPTKAMEQVVREYRKLLKGVLLGRFGRRETSGRAWEHKMMQGASFRNLRALEHRRRDRGDRVE